MSEDTNTPAGDAPEKPKVRRISSKPARKKTAGASESLTKESDSYPPEVEIATELAENGKPDQKRSNRRRRGKGKPSGQSSDQARDTESSPESGAEASVISDTEAASGKKEDLGSREKAQHNQRPAQNPRRKPDPEKVAKNAWKIFLAEVSEEGVALIGDNDARELARRCFRLSEIFLEEADRRN